MKKSENCDVKNFGSLAANILSRVLKIKIKLNENKSKYLKK